MLETSKLDLNSSLTERQREKKIHMLSCITEYQQHFLPLFSLLKCAFALAEYIFIYNMSLRLFFMHAGSILMQGYV